MAAARPRVAKVVLLGDQAVGKSSLVQRFHQNKFDERAKPTIGAAFVSKDVVTDTGENVKLEIWDTGGQERFRSMANLYYRNASAAIVVYDITDANSFATMQTWIEELEEKAPSNITVTIVGNKKDCGEKRQVPREKGEEYALQRHRSARSTLFAETSAKTGANVEQMFVETASKLPRDTTAEAQSVTGVRLASEDGGGGKKKGCC